MILIGNATDNCHRASCCLRPALVLKSSFSASSTAMEHCKARPAYTQRRNSFEHRLGVVAFVLGGRLDLQHLRTENPSFSRGVPYSLAGSNSTGTGLRRSTCAVTLR